jgi:hypothetical protein
LFGLMLFGKRTVLYCFSVVWVCTVIVFRSVELTLGNRELLFFFSVYTISWKLTAIRNGRVTKVVNTSKVRNMTDFPKQNLSLCNIHPVYIGTVPNPQTIAYRAISVLLLLGQKSCVRWAEQTILVRKKIMFHWHTFTYVITN